MGIRRKLAELRAEVAELRAMLEVQRAAPEPAIPHEVPESVVGSTTVTGRRDVVKKAGMVAAGALGGAVLAAKPAAAADPNDVVKNAVNGVTARTEMRYTGAVLNQNIFTVQDGTFGTTSRPAAVAGWASSNSGVTNGVYGWTNDRVDNDVNTGHALIGYHQSGGRSHVYLIPGGGSPKADGFNHTVGELRQDVSSNLWHCTSSFPSPAGTWKKLSGPNSAGSFNFLATPQRAYDSRPSQGGPGSFAANETRTVSMAVSGMPTGINGVALNVTIVTPAGGGWSIIWAAGASQPGVSSINYAPGQIVGNNVFSAVDASRNVSVFTVAQTDIVIDVVGYFE